MPTVDLVLNLARKQLGYRESPPHSNRTRYGAWYGLNGQPWCMMFLMWLFYMLGGMKLLPCRTASCGQFMRAAQEAGNWHTGTDCQPGDIVIFTFSGNRKAEHCGIVEAVRDGYIVTIEGNTATGNDSNGGEVMRRNRAYSVVLGAFRPAYDAARKSLAETARAVQRGEYGSGQNRRTALEREGFSYDVVQQIVNELVHGSQKTPETLAREVWDGKWGKGAEREERLTAAGYDYQAVRDAVNDIAAKKEG